MLLIQPAFRKGLRVLLVALLAAGAGGARAQGFGVIASEPQDGAVGVSLEATITFIFSRQAALSNDWDRILRFEPRDAITPKLLTIGDVNTGLTNVIFFDVEHTPDTDFIWLISGLRSIEGIVAPPFVLRYTTAPEWGTNTIAGFVSDQALGTSSRRTIRPPRVVWRQPRQAASAIRHAINPAGREPAYADGRSVLPFPRKAAAPATPENAIIFLADRNMLDDDDWSMRAAGIVVDASGAYTIPHVRDGVYWPAAVKDLDGGGPPFEALGFYDPDGDAQPDSLVVNGDGVITGIDIALFDFVPVTARENLTLASDHARRFADDQALLLVRSARVAPDGTNLEWSYDFYSPANKLATTIATTGFFVEIDTVAAPDLFADLRPLPHTFLDSDAAKETADQNGGLAFLNDHASDPITLTMTAGNQVWKTPRDPDNVFWDVEYLAATDTAFVQFNLFVDAETGGVFIPTATETETPAGLTLAPNYPNPFDRVTTIPFVLPQATHVTLTVYDVLGRAVATLVDEVRPAGPHTVAWQPNDLPDGLYLYRLQAGDASRSGMTILMR